MSLVLSLVETVGSQTEKRRSLRHEYSLCSWDFLSGPSRHRRSPSQFNLMQPTCFVPSPLFTDNEYESKVTTRTKRKRSGGSSRVRRAMAQYSRRWKESGAGGRWGFRRI